MSQFSPVPPLRSEDARPEVARQRVTSPRMPSALRPALGVILSQFPRYDETFILREVAELARDERPLAIFSLRPCRDRVVHAHAKALQPNTLYVPFLWSIDVWRSHAHFLRRSSKAYWSSLRWIVSRHWRQPAILIKTLAFFPKTVHFARLAEERGIVHLHAFWATYPASAALIISRLTGIPYSLSGHAHDLYTANPALAEKVQQARFVLTCTETNKRHIEQLVDQFLGSRVRGFAGSEATAHSSSANSPTRQLANVLVSYHGVDVTRFAPQPKAEGGRCTLLAVGSLLPCKGFETLIDACALLQSRHIPFHCTIAGGGPLEQPLRRRIARHGLESHMTITGVITQELVVGLYQRAHLFLLPLVSKIHWGIPNVLIESLATKTPVICCDLPSLRELLDHGRSGWIVPEHDPHALADAVTLLWSDAPLRDQLGLAGHRHVIERFSLEQTGRALRSLFDAALTNHHGAPCEAPPARSPYSTDARTPR